MKVIFTSQITNQQWLISIQNQSKDFYTIIFINFRNLFEV